MNFFNRFQDMEFNESALDVALVPKDTIVVTYEQVLFYMTGAAEAEKYRKAERLRELVGKRYGRVLCERDRVLLMNPKYVELETAVKNASRYWEGPEEGKDERKAKHEALRIERADFGDKICPDYIEREVERVEGMLDTLNDVMENTKFTVSNVSPVENVVNFGVLDYTRAQGFDTWDEDGIVRVFDCLKNKVIDHVEETPEKIMIFSGLYARDNPYKIASHLASVLELPKGVVEVYGSGFVKPEDWYKQGYNERNRWGICKDLMKLMPDTVAKVEISSNSVGSILGAMK